MTRQFFIGLGAGFILGAAIALGTVAVINGGRLVQPQTDSSMASMTMDDMSKELAQLKGDAFDKRFIELMIEHHNGAISMATLAQDRSAHDEVKKLSGAIISAQQLEVADMRTWQQQWGYADPMAGMNHMSQ